MKATRKCAVEECEGSHIAKGYCFKHYQRVRAHGDPHTVRPQPGAAEVRRKRLAQFWDHLMPEGECWTWVGARRGAVDPYGRYMLDGKNWLVHRLSWEQMVGPIPDGLTLDHLCRNTRCVNPDHLEPVPNEVNRARAAAAHKAAAE